MQNETKVAIFIHETYFVGTKTKQNKQNKTKTNDQSID